MNLPLLELPYPDWKNKANKLLEDNYVANKCDRNRRIKEKYEYINNYCQEIKAGGGKVLDIGPGPGEFLEICRYYRNDIQGIDAKFNDYGGMGEEYLQYSKLMSDRQKIPVLYEGLDHMLESGPLPFDDKTFTFINSQGSITYIFNKYLNLSGKIETSIKLHQQKKESFRWKITEKITRILNIFFREMNRILRSDGILLIYVNNPGGQALRNYKKLIMTGSDICRFKLIFERFGALHKWRK